MIKINSEDLLKDSIDYEEYSENICKLTVEELREEGLLKCGGCCSNGKKEGNKCSGCKSKKGCEK